MENKILLRYDDGKFEKEKCKNKLFFWRWSNVTALDFERNWENGKWFFWNWFMWAFKRASK
jgi:hypothetical protein